MSESANRAYNFKKELDEIKVSEGVLDRGYEAKVLSLINEHFDLEDIFDDEDLQNYFEEEIANGGNLSAIAYDHIQEQIDDGEINGCDLIDLSTDDHRAQFTAFVQANFTREELFPETKPIITSDSISGEVSRQVETLEAQNARLVAENQRLKQQLQAIKSLLHAN